jgi:hypothetical protein
MSCAIPTIDSDRVTHRTHVQTLLPPLVLHLGVFSAHACSHDTCIHSCLQGSTQQFSSERTTTTCGQLANGNTMDEAASGGGGSATVVMEETQEDGAAAAMSTTRESARATRNDEQLRVAETLRAGRRATFATHLLARQLVARSCPHVFFHPPSYFLSQQARFLTTLLKPSHTHTHTHTHQIAQCQCRWAVQLPFRWTRMQQQARA